MIESKLKIVVFIFLIHIVALEANNQRISARKCKEYESATQKSKRMWSIRGEEPRYVVDNRCLHKAKSLIINGEPADKHEFPHQALLGYEKYFYYNYDYNYQLKWLCGGSLISSNFVLTAAHCTKNRQFGDVKYAKLGMNNRSQTDSKVSTYNVTKIIVHPDYNRRTKNNDIALLELETKVSFTEYLYPICLPTSQPTNSEAIVTGFGQTGEYHAVSERLMKVIVKKFTHDECEEALRFEVNQNTMLCYGNHTHSGDSCRGDSGGPIQVGNNDESKCTYKLIGIVSFGIRMSGTPGIPGVYVNVFNYLDWIERIVWKEDIRRQTRVQYRRDQNRDIFTK